MEIESEKTMRSLGTGRPILVAEDDPLDLTLLENTLSMLGVANPVLSFPDGANLLRYLDPAPAARLARKEVPPALLLLDLKMPGMDGFEVIAELRQHSCFAELPIVVISGLASPREIARAMELGADDCLLKPVDRRKRRCGCLVETGTLK